MYHIVLKLCVEIKYFGMAQRNSLHELSVLPFAHNTFILSEMWLYSWPVSIMGFTYNNIQFLLWENEIPEPKFKLA